MRNLSVAMREKSNSIIRFFKREKGDTIKEKKIADQAQKYHQQK